MSFDKSLELWVFWQGCLRFVWVKTGLERLDIGKKTLIARRRVLKSISLPMSIRMADFEDSNFDRNDEKEILSCEPGELELRCLCLKNNGENFFDTQGDGWVAGLRFAEFITTVEKLLELCELDLNSLLVTVSTEKDSQRQMLVFKLAYKKSTDSFRQRLQLFYLGLTALADARQLRISLPYIMIGDCKSGLFEC